MKALRRIVLHVGPEKCGSTTIQGALGMDPATPGLMADQVRGVLRMRVATAGPDGGCGRRNGAWSWVFPLIAPFSRPRIGAWHFAGAAFVA